MDRAFDHLPNFAGQLVHRAVPNRPFHMLEDEFAILGAQKARSNGSSFSDDFLGNTITWDLVNLLLRRAVEGTIGATVAGALIFYLCRMPVRAVFKTESPKKRDRDQEAVRLSFRN